MKTEKTKRKRYIFKIITVLLVIVIFYILSEYTVSIIYKPFHDIYSAFKAESSMFNLQMFEDDPELIQRLTPGIEMKHPVTQKPIYINSLGFRGAEFNLEKEQGVRRLVFLGDSTMFGMGLGEHETIPQRIAKSLEGKNPKGAVEVVNLAVPGYTSFQGRKLAKLYFQTMKPDITVISYGFTDSMLIENTDKVIQGSIRKASSVFNSLENYFGWSPIFQLLKNKFRPKPVESAKKIDSVSGNAKTSLTARVTPKEFTDNIMSIIKETRNAGGKCILVDPNIVNYYCRDALIQISRNEKIPLIIIRETLEEKYPEGAYAKRDRSGLDKKIIAIQVIGLPEKNDALNNSVILIKTPKGDIRNPLYSKSHSSLNDNGKAKDIKVNDGVYTTRMLYSENCKFEFAPTVSLILTQQMARTLFVNNETFYTLPAPETLDGPGVYYSPLFEIGKPSFLPLLSPINNSLINNKGAQLVVFKIIPQIMTILRQNK